jgi:uncharacterized protein (DUF849 family)
MKSDHPGVPFTADEIAAATLPAFEAGAAMVHVHVRDADGTHVLDADLYREAIAGIRAAVGGGMLVQITTEAVGRYSPEQQIAVVKDVRPEAVSLAFRELCPAGGESGFIAFLEWMRRERVAPQVILYSPAEVARLAGMVRGGHVPFTTLPVLYVLGREAPPGRPQDLPGFVAAADGFFPDFMICAFGRTESRCCALSALLGGGVRVGFENNIERPDGTLAGSNAELVEIVAAALAPLDLRPETAEAWRERLQRIF